jgi:hypothetical protein
MVISWSNANCQQPAKIKDDPNDETVWVISNPDVTKARVDYPTVKFSQNDKVVVTGGGCVQTGGHGLTWKRYINPSGNNSDRLYHARIWIPGATDGMVRVSSIINITGSSPSQGIPLLVGMFPPHPPDSSSGESDPYFLRLGYEDDKYPDNGYTPKKKHDNGTDNQCTLDPKVDDDKENDGNAWLKIRIIHLNSPTYSSLSIADPRAPMDLWWDRVDDNFLPFNPDWWIHHHNNVIPNSNSADGCDRFREGPNDKLIRARDPRCTTWDPDVDEANILSGFCALAAPFADSVHGHVNWGVVTIRGRIYFDVANIGLQGGNVPGDGDYDWWFSPTDDVYQQIDNAIAEANVATSGDKRAIALEFSSRETVDRIKDPGSWWDDFHHTVDQSREEAQKKVDNSKAIVIGLLGFDNEHGDRPPGARVELHPVYGLAIRTSKEGAGEDVWTILARNWGNEGSCSNGWDATGGKWQHYLPLPGNKMKFFLPGDAGNSAQITTSFKTNYGNATNKFRTKALADGVLLTISLPKPEKEKLFWGELHIRKSQ